jgi:membrane protease YdiL (CAAX protease family)
MTALDSPDDPLRRSSLRFAWVIVLLLTVPEIVLGAFLQIDLWWMTGARIAFLGGLIALSFASTTIRPLRGMLVVFFVIYAVEGWLFLTVLPGTSVYVDAISGDATLAFFAERLSRLGAVVVMIAVLLAMGLKRRDLYLAIGDLRATAEPSARWVPRRPEPWTRFGRNYAIISVALLLLFLIPAFGPSIADATLGIVLFAAVCAAMNAFAEEFLYRAALIPQVLPVIGKGSTLILLPIWFGLAHWFGVPSGLTGVILAAIGGWFFAKSMIETRGMAWAWLLHFLADFTVYLVLLLAGAL